MVEALRGVTLDIREGEMVSVTGKSGAGKSTLLHMIGTLDRPTSGSVILGQTNVSELSDSQVSRFRNRSVGFIFQMNNLLPEFSAIENVMMPGIIGGFSRKALMARGLDLLGQVGLGQRSAHRPSELSGGEQQRVAIARALIMSPPLLVADEPTGNLDRKTSLMIQDLLINMVKEFKLTMVLVTHDLELAARLPRQIIMEDGNLISPGVVS
ncbi:MAG: ABC transporter ATP-binding protein [Proteobacteria bacterium]|nr:ABC transporter ATP-binding protein [Pseudomonadota bacterium]